MKSQKKTAPLLIAAGGALWGIIGVFSASLSEAGFSSIQITASRCVITAVAIVLFLLIKDPSKLKIKPKDIILFIGTGVGSIIFFNICYFTAIKETSLSLAAVLLYTAPCFVIIMSAIFFKEKITAVKFAALVLSFVGCMLTTGVLGGTKASLIGVIFGLGSGFGYSLYSIIGSVALKKYDTLTVTAYTFIVAAIAVIPFCGAGEIISILSAKPPAMIPFLLIGTVSTIAPYLLYTKGLENTQPGTASIIAFIEPLVATLVGIFMFREAPTVQSISGIILIFVSIILININFGGKNDNSAV